MLRYLVSLSYGVRIAGGFPFATFTVNLVGSFLIGYFFSLAENRGAFSPALLLFLTTGILGGFTTFSAFGLETVTLLEEGRVGIAALYAIGSLVLGILAVVLGRSLA